MSTTDVAKRICDTTLSLVALVLLLPFILLIYVFIILEHALRLRPLDPIFYKDERISKGKKFNLYKFNIFKHEKILELRRSNTFVHTKILEKSGSLILTGHVLKQIYMDELPQLWNVLLGEMSLVGPRPINLEVYNKLSPEARRSKNLVKAGITGYFQSLKKTGNAEKLDREYVEFYLLNPWYKVLFFDAKIMLRTVKVILAAKGV